MNSLTTGDRRALAAIGAVALIGLVILGWQQWRPPLRVTGTPAPVSAPQWDNALEAARQIDVNTASVAELERLPGVGPALAQRVAQDRAARGPFRTVEELARVPGIGPHTLQELRAYVTVESDTHRTDDQRHQ